MSHLPKNADIALMRHAESWENVKQVNGNSIISQSGLPTWVNKNDPDLSDRGCLQALHAAKFISDAFGMPDVMVHSQKRRTWQTLDMMLSIEASLSPKRLHIIDNGFEEQRHWPEAATCREVDLMQQRRNSLELALKMLQNGVPIESAAARLHLPPRLIDWRQKQMQLPAYARKKLPEGESFLNLRHRVTFSLQKVFSQGQAQNCSKYFFIVHAKTALAIISILKDLNIKWIESMLNINGLPFPPNSGFCVIRIRDGRIQSDALSWQLSPFLESKGRKVELKATAENLDEHIRMVEHLCASTPGWRGHGHHRVSFDPFVPPPLIAPRRQPAASAELRISA